MIAFSYIARDRSNQVQRGQMSAQSPIELRSRLHAVDLQLVSYDTASWNSRLNFIRAVHPNRWLPVRSRDIELTLKQLAMMLRSGLRLLDALKALQLQAQRHSLSLLLASVHDAIARGESLGNAMAAHKVIPSVVIQLVNVGEQTGSLEIALQQCEEYLTQRRTMLTEIRTAVAYPAFVTLAALAVASYLVVFVIPQLQTFLSAMGRDLPAMTKSLVDLSHWIRVNSVTLVVCVVSIPAAVAVMLYSKRGRLILDRCLLRIPILGDALRLSGTTGLARSLSIMMKSGIRLVGALKIATESQGNCYLASLLRNASYSVACGNPLAPSLATKHGFSPILPSMVEVAERSGNMDSTLGEVANLCQSELKSKIKRMSQLVEPAVILVAGGIVGYVYVAFFVALMSAGGGIR